MNRNFIDFPPWRKSRGLLQDLPLLAQDLVLAPQPLGCHILLAVLGRIIDLALAAAVDPVAQGRPGGRTRTPHQEQPPDHHRLPCIQGYQAMQARIRAVAELYDVISRSSTLGPVAV